MLEIYDMRTEYLKNPFAISSGTPRFSWKLKSDRKGIKQLTYLIRVQGEDGEMWDSGKVRSEASHHVRYEGKRLKSKKNYSWQIEVSAIDGDGKEERSVSEIADFGMGILNPKDWKAKWIGAEKISQNETLQPVQYYRKSFCIKKRLKKAKIFVTAHGIYEFWINGHLGTEDKFKPGFTSYYKRLQYQAYDITNLLKPGENVWSAAVGDGWWRGVTGGDIRNNFGSELAYYGQIELEYEDGTSELVITDEEFLTGTGGLLESDMKIGEKYDASKEPKGWKEKEFCTEGWKNAVVLSGKRYEISNLILSNSVPVREKEHLTGRIFKDANDDLVIDFGQNIAGYVAMRFRNLKKGQLVTVEHGEDMKDGCFYNENISHNTPIQGLKRFQQIDYLAEGKAIEDYKPFGMVAGFRYIRIRGYSGEIKEDDFTAIAVYSDNEENGEFECSNQLLNQLVKNSRWSQKGNFLDVPTDCPTRERSPWTGDAQVYARTAAWFADVYLFFEKWLKDVAAEQCDNGKILNIVPNTMMAHDEEQIKRMEAMSADGAEENRDEKNSLSTELTEEEREAQMRQQIVNMIYADDGAYVIDGSAGWGDAASIIPWNMYMCYGDKKILENQYECARKWADYMISNAKNRNKYRAEAPWYGADAGNDGEYIWDTRYHWGEWLEPDKENDVMMGMDIFVKPDPEVPTAFLCHTTELIADMAKELGYKEDEVYYRHFSKRCKEIFNKYLIPENGVIKEGRQAPQVRALAFKICNDSNEKKVAEQLNQMVESGGYFLNTGFLATPYLLPVLADYGYVESAYKILEQEECPGWLYNVKNGATTIPESWKSMVEKTDSQNHYSYGAVCDFLFSRTAGIMIDEKQPGYKHFIVKPIPGGSLKYAKAKYESIYGSIRSEWKKTENKIEFTVEIPCNTTAAIHLPSGEVYETGSGVYTYKC